MSGFSNPIVGNRQLIRSAIESANFVTGVSGWRISRDGSAEFQDLLARATIILGALTGAHVILDSATSSIRIFDSSNRLKLLLSPNDQDGEAAFDVFDNAGSRVAKINEFGLVVYDTAGNQLAALTRIGFSATDVATGNITVTLDSTGLIITDPSLAGLIRLSGADSSITAADFIDLDGNSLARGKVGTPFESTGNDPGGARAAGINTDMVVSINADATRLYRVFVHAQFALGTLSTAYRLNAVQDGTAGSANGSIVGTVDRINNSVSATGTIFVNGSLLWKPSAGAHTIRVGNDAASGGTILGQGSAANPRQMWVEDIGAR